MNRSRRPDAGRQATGGLSRVVPVLVGATLVALLGTGAVPPAGTATAAASAPAATARAEVDAVAGRLLLVAVTAGGGGAPRVVSVRGCGVVWTRATRSVGAAGTAEIWSGRSVRGLSGCVVTARLARAGSATSMAVRAIPSVRLGRSAVAVGPRGPVRVPLNVRRGSLVFGTAVAARRGAAPAPAARQRAAVRPVSAGTHWSQWTTRPTQAAGPADLLADIGASAWSAAAVELLPAGPVAAPVAPFDAASFPGASDTGVPDGTVLTPLTGFVVTEAGTVIDGRDVDGEITVAAPGVVIRNSRIEGMGDGLGVNVRSGDVTILDSEIVGFDTGITGDRWTALRVDIHGMTGDGVKFGDDVTLQDSWVHDLTPGPGAHLDGGQLQGGVTDLVVRHNTIEVGRQANAALFLAPDLGPSTEGPVLIQGNLLAGGGYTLFCVDGDRGTYTIDNITIRGNYFADDHDFGPARVNVPVTWAGNVMTDGMTVPLPD